MKLLRYGPLGQEKPGLLCSQGLIRDLSPHIDDLAGDVLSPAGLDRLRSITPEDLAVVPEGVRLGAPVAGSRNFIGIGLNYADHAAETGAEIPSEPVMFLKSLNAISGPNDDIIIPDFSQKTDWELELAVIIGQTARRVSEADALDYVAGYSICNDLSEREWQLERGGDWCKGKSLDGYGSVGPWLVTPDEVGDPQNLDMWLDVDGERMQTGSTKTMIFPVSTIVSYLSTFMTLHPGDIITTGTPPGVGLGHKPPRFLSPGQVVTLGIKGLGTQRQETRQG